MFSFQSVLLFFNHRARVSSNTEALENYNGPVRLERLDYLLLTSVSCHASFLVCSQYNSRLELMVSLLVLYRMRAVHVILAIKLQHIRAMLFSYRNDRRQVYASPTMNSLFKIGSPPCPDGRAAGNPVRPRIHINAESKILDSVPSACTYCSEMSRR